MRLWLLITGILILLAACKPAAIEPKKCSYDSDCICGGIDKKTGQCFLGNSQYYEKFVDKETKCPDFCGGIAGNLEVKCVSNQCVQQVMQKQPITEVPVCGNNKCETGEDSCPFSCPKDAICEINCGPVYCPEDCGRPALNLAIANPTPIVGQQMNIRLKPTGTLYSWQNDDFSIEKLDGNWQRMPHKLGRTIECRDNRIVIPKISVAPSRCLQLGEETKPWSGKLLHQREKWCGNATYAEEELIPAEPGHYRIVYRYHLKQDCGDNPFIATAEFDVLSGIDEQTTTQASECTTSADCGTGGCSGQVCTQKDRAKGAITTCEFTQEYECLKTSANCGCINGKCMWSRGAAFEQCMNG